ncbi:hypothetical protein [Bacillus atrophaeus]|uniref:hypothetical protein n=1 Tax=Bacillus atrophaeus TaxID=1452 RepID=UPI0022822140|nr:hypothetical protein [Bacillus atrophaeus]MCY7947935.1 hypothetical protein [Bacillus atrophaeus]MCY8098266.1 hypothetical protein [Bacillus atrophaeus]MCY9170043.1 hypothetical protein [Bacillus atrophaeus]MEC0740597.1 hypothetical protein [Bacillus atrophaeus]MEC0746967.1 hypothetical protein [Bacillus atrophaeus]
MNQLIIKSGTEKTILFNLFNWNKEKAVLSDAKRNTYQAERNLKDYMNWADEIGISFRLQNLFLNASNPKGEAMDVVRENKILIIN